MQEPIEPGYMVFVADGKLGVGAVREVFADSREVVVNIENGGDFILPADAIRDVHEGKVILDVDHLPQAMRQALEHPHDAEYPIYAAQDPQDGALGS
jgi:predicted urease superfamily metal-dependent hydrolase